MDSSTHPVENALKIRPQIDKTAPFKTHDRFNHRVIKTSGYSVTTPILISIKRNEQVIYRPMHLQDEIMYEPGRQVKYVLLARLFIAPLPPKAQCANTKWAKL